MRKAGTDHLFQNLEHKYKIHKSLAVSKKEKNSSEASTPQQH